MPQNDLEIRVEHLEKAVAGLAGLPQQVRELSTQFLQLREQVHADISGVRGEVGELRAEVHAIRHELRGEMHGIGDELRGEMHGIRDELRGEMHGFRDELRGEMHGFRDELRTEMHGMHDVLVARIDGCRDELRGEMHGMHDELVARIDGCRDELRGDMASMHHDLAQIIQTNHAQALSLHENLIERIKLLGEGLKQTADQPPRDAR